MNEIAIPTFLDFYMVYPKKTMKAEAEQKWNLLSDDDKRAAINDTLVRKQIHGPWLTGNEFIPNPARYLFRRLWTDEIIQKTTHEDKQKEAEGLTGNPVLARLWTMLIQIYGMKMIRSYGETMPKAWQYSLKDLSQKEAQKILQYLSKDQDEKMPDLPKINRIRAIGRDAGVYLSLPKASVSDKKTALSFISEIKSAIRYNY